MKSSLRVLSTPLLAALAGTSIFGSAKAAAPDLKDKVVLANPEKYQVTLKFGTTQRQINTRRASVLSPKRYPVNLEFWSGKAAVGWTKMQIPSAGVYDFSWQSGQWTLAARPPRSASSTPTSRSTRLVSPYGNSTGSYRRTVRGPVYTPGRPTYVRRPPVYRGGWSHPRWSLWCRGLWGLGRLYQFVRDEEDRDLIRDIIIGREVDDAIRREIEDAIDDHLVAVPYAERLELQRAMDDISRLNPDDWKEITTLPADDLDRLREEIGEDISDTDWDGLGDWMDTMDEPIGEDADLGDFDIDTMDENIDLGNLNDGEENLDLDFGQDIEDINLEDLAGDAGTLDLSDFGDGGYQGGLDFGDVGGQDIGIDDVDLGGGDFFDF